MNQIRIVVECPDGTVLGTVMRGIPDSLEGIRIESTTSCLIAEAATDSTAANK